MSVADGVGSSKYSDIAAKMAVISTCEYIAQKKVYTPDVIKDAFSHALDEITKFAERHDNDGTDYDTTLHTVLYDGTKIIFGHAGDGGIVGLAMDGSFVQLTKPQKGADATSVMPLRAGPKHWEFGTSNQEFAGALLATDGVYDTFFPYLLRGQPVEAYVPLIKLFFEKSETDIKQILESDTYKHVTDDMTVVVVKNKKAKAGRQPDEYYAQPDWDKLKEDWKRKAYPHLYTEE